MHRLLWVSAGTAWLATAAMTWAVEVGWDHHTTVETTRTLALGLLVAALLFPRFAAVDVAYAMGVEEGERRARVRRATIGVVRALPVRAAPVLPRQKVSSD